MKLEFITEKHKTIQDPALLAIGMREPDFYHETKVLMTRDARIKQGWVLGYIKNTSHRTYDGAMENVFEVSFHTVNNEKKELWFSCFKSAKEWFSDMLETNKIVPITRKLPNGAGVRVYRIDWKEPEKK